MATEEQSGGGGIPTKGKGAGAAKGIFVGVMIGTLSFFCQLGLRQFDIPPDDVEGLGTMAGATVFMLLTRFRWWTRERQEESVAGQQEGGA